MNGGEPVRTWRTYADDEWARITWTAADPLSVDEEPWQPDPADEQRGTFLGFVLLLLAFAAGFAAGWWAR